MANGNSLGQSRSSANLISSLLAQPSPAELEAPAAPGAAQYLGTRITSSVSSPNHVAHAISSSDEALQLRYAADTGNILGAEHRMPSDSSAGLKMLPSQQQMLMQQLHLQNQQQLILIQKMQQQQQMMMTMQRLDSSVIGGDGGSNGIFLDMADKDLGANAALMTNEAVVFGQEKESRSKTVTHQLREGFKPALGSQIMVHEFGSAKDNPGNFLPYVIPVPQSAYNTFLLCKLTAADAAQYDAPPVSRCTHPSCCTASSGKQQWVDQKTKQQLLRDGLAIQVGSNHIIFLHYSVQTSALSLSPLFYPNQCSQPHSWHILVPVCALQPTAEHFAHPPPQNNNTTTTRVHISSHTLTSPPYVLRSEDGGETVAEED